jgi:hypothetical protein
MKNQDVPEALLTATFHRTGPDGGTFELQDDFHELFECIDRARNHFLRMARRDTTHEFQCNLEGARKLPRHAVRRPTIRGWKLPDMNLGLHTSGRLFRLNQNLVVVGWVSDLYLTKRELERVCRALGTLLTND